MARSPRARTIRVRAFAKINLALRVLGSRPDGYHDLRTVFQSVALHDTLTFQQAPGAFLVGCDDPACPTDAANLVWRAADRVWKAAGRRGAPRDVRVRIAKRIPLEAGLGGGSSDAAAAIRALTILWRVDLTGDRVHEIAASLGADVPYFLEGGTVLGVERGDVLYSLQDVAPAWVVLVVPAFGVSTTKAYEWWESSRGDAERGNGPLRARYQRAGVGPREKVRKVDTAVRSVPLIGRELRNDLAGPVAERHPEIARLVRALTREGASYAAMSGSGSTVFGLFGRRGQAASAALRLARRGRRVILTRTLNRSRYRALTRRA